MKWDYSKRNMIIYIYIYIYVGSGSLQSGLNSIWAQGPCRGGLLPRTNDRWLRCQGERLRNYPVLGTPELQWGDQRLGEGYPQIAPWRGCEWNGAHGEAGCKIGSGKMRPLRIKCTCQRPDPVNKKRRLDGVTSIFATSRT